MEFEYDINKSKANKRKHGIDFIEIQEIWNDENLIEIPAKKVDEPRYMAIGKIKEKHWSVIVTRRSEKIRIISARRSRNEEVNLYESS
ncbi:MAG: BrnT family toxin [bacterium]